MTSIRQPQNPGIGGLDELTPAEESFLTTFAGSATVGGLGTILRSNGTTWGATTSTYPTTNTVNQILYGINTNVFGGNSTLTYDGTNLLATAVQTITINGGINANDDITIQGTTNATRTSSYVIIQPNGGNVGIGTTTPGALLEIAKSSAGATVSAFIHNTGASTLNSTADLGFGTWTNELGTSPGAKISVINTDASTGANAMTFFTKSTAGTVNEGMRITSQGNVGIGTTTPNSNLNIYNSTAGNPVLNANSGLMNLGTGALNELAIGAYSNGSYGLWLQGKYTTNSTNSLPILLNPLGGGVGVGYADPGTATLAINGNVGIGTTAPTAVLHLKAGTASASTAPLKLTSGTLNTTAEAGAIEFLTDDYFATITTGATRKAFILDDGTRLTSGKVPVATTNGRLVDSSGVSGSFTTVDLKTVTVTNGLITSIV